MLLPLLNSHQLLTSPNRHALHQVAPACHNSTNFPRWFKMGTPGGEEPQPYRVQYTVRTAAVLLLCCLPPKCVLLPPSSFAASLHLCSRSCAAAAWVSGCPVKARLVTSRLPLRDAVASTHCDFTDLLLPTCQQRSSGACE